MRRLPAVGLVLALALTGASACSSADEPDGSAVAVAAAGADRKITLTRWDSARQWRRGHQAGTAVRDGRLAFDRRVASTTAGGGSYDVSRSTSRMMSESRPGEAALNWKPG